MVVNLFSFPTYGSTDYLTVSIRTMEDLPYDPIRDDELLDTTVSCRDGTFRTSSYVLKSMGGCCWGYVRRDRPGYYMDVREYNVDLMQACLDMAWRITECLDEEDESLPPKRVMISPLQYEAVRAWYRAHFVKAEYVVYLERLVSH